MSAQGGGLTAVAQLRREEERVAAAEFRAACERLEQELDNLNKLQACYPGGPGEDGVTTPQHIMHRRSFFGRLREVEQRQQGLIETQHSVVEAARARWINARMQREALEKLLVERAAQRTRAEERRLQSQVDEQASRAGSQPR